MKNSDEYKQDFNISCKYWFILI